MSNKSRTHSPSLSGHTSFHRSDDGSLHVETQRLVIETRHNTLAYTLPDGIGTVVRVQLFSPDSRPFEFLECPATVSYIRLFASGKQPESPEEARALLKSVYAKFGKNLWLKVGDKLHLYPAPVNAGELLIVDTEPKTSII